MAVIRVGLVALVCGFVFAVTGGLVAATLDWLAPGYYPGVYPYASSRGHASAVGGGNGIIQGLMLGLLVGAAMAAGLSWFGQLHLAACVRSFAILAGSAFLFAFGGGLVGLALGVFLPGYYQGIVSGGAQPGFNPADVGVGLGASQGAMLGAIVGGSIVVALAWRHSRPWPHAITSQTAQRSPYSGR